MQTTLHHRSTWGAALPVGRLAPLVAAVLASALLAGCVTTVRPPAAPADPVEVYLVDHGRTPSLVLPAAEGGMVRYAYGDWRWYALGRKTSGAAVSALLRSTPAALGRQDLGGPHGIATVRAAVFVEIEAIYPVAVERERATALVERLEELFRLRSGTLTANRENGLAFVRHPVPYTLLHSSNRVAADWLRELGCEVRGRALLPRWKLAPAAASAGAGGDAVDSSAETRAPTSPRPRPR